MSPSAAPGAPTGPRVAPTLPAATAAAVLAVGPVATVVELPSVGYPAAISRSSLPPSYLASEWSTQKKKP